MFEVVIDWREGFPECGEMGVFFLSIGIWLCLDVIEWIFLSACHNRNRSCAQKCLLHFMFYERLYRILICQTYYLFAIEMWCFISLQGYFIWLLIFTWLLNFQVVTSLHENIKVQPLWHYFECVGYTWQMIEV